MTFVDRLIADYKTACMAANGFTPIVTAFAGWITIIGRRNTPFRIRAVELAGMTRTLQERTV